MELTIVIVPGPKLSRGLPLRILDEAIPSPGVARNDVAYCPLNYPAENSTKFV